MSTLKNKKFWTCIVGPADESEIPFGGDLPFRMTVQSQFETFFGKQAAVCSSGWHSGDEYACEEDVKRSALYCVKKTCSPEPEMVPFTTGELLRQLSNYAKTYSQDAVNSVKRNEHMNDLTPKDKINQRIVDAILVDFINYIGVENCVDYGIYARDLNGPQEEKQTS